MLEKIKAFFFKEKTTTKVSTSIGETLELKKPISNPVIDKLRKSEEVSLTEISLLMSDMFDCKAIKSKYLKFHKVLVDEAMFEISHVHLLEDEGTGKSCVTLHLREVSFGINMTVQIDPKDFHDVFKPHLLNMSKENTN